MVNICIELASTSYQSMKCQKDDRTTDRAAFTLIESLLVIVLIGILASMLIPTLSRVRYAAWGAASLSNLRSHGQIFGLYTDDFREIFPYFTDPTVGVLSIVRGGNLAIAVNYFAAHTMWSIALADQFYDGDPQQDSFFPGRFKELGWDGQGRGAYSPYYYGCSFIARPEYWNTSTRTGPSQWGPTRTSDVTFTDSKVLIYETYSDGYYDLVEPGWNMPPASTFVDGSVRRYKQSAYALGYPRGDGPWHDGNHHIAIPHPLHTIDGVRGRDVGRR